MNRNRGIIIIALCLILIIILGVFLVKGTTQRIGLPLSVFNFKINDSRLSEENQYSVKIGDVENIELSVSVDDILIEESNDEDIKIIEKSNYKLENSEKLQINQEEKNLEIVRNDRNTIGNLNNINRRLEIYLPKDYRGSLTLENTVGDIKIHSKLNVEELNTRQKVGDLKLNSNIECNTFSFENTTGDMDIKSIKGSGSIEGKVGNIRCYLEEITGDIIVENSTGDIDLEINPDSSFILDSKYNIGELDININLDNSTTSKKHISGSYGDNAKSTLNVEANIGDISIMLK